MTGPRDDVGSSLAETYRLLAAGPDLFLKEFDFHRATACFVPMTEQSYRESTFLDYRVKRTTEQVLDLDSAILTHLAPRFAEEKRPIHYIFHVGHCGSSFVSRLLGRVPGFFSLREPEPLQVLSRHVRLLSEPVYPVNQAQWDQAFAVVAALLSRTYRPSDVALIKPSSFCNRLMRPLLDWTPECRAIFLYVDLEPYVATMLQPTYREETDYVMATYHRMDLFRILGPDAPDPATCSDAQRAALVWLANISEIVEILDDSMRGHAVRVLNFDNLVADCTRRLREAAAFLGNDISDMAAETAASDPAVKNVHAKDQRRPYDATTRKAEMAQLKETFADEIGDALDWVDHLGKENPAAGRIIEFAATLDQRQ